MGKWTMWPFVLLILVTIAVLAIVLAKQMPSQRMLREARARLQVHLNDGREYRIFVGFPLKHPQQWRVVRKDSAAVLHLDDGTIVRPEHVNAFVVTYPSGTLLDSFGEFGPPPDGVTSFRQNDIDAPRMLRDSDYASGSRRVTVSYGPCASRPNVPHYYSTSLRNQTDERVRVIWFAGYAPANGQWQMNTVTGRPYSATEFSDWYGAKEGGWIEAGVTVSDPNNYGGLPALWVYCCETPAGEQFLTGAVKSQ